MKSGNNFVELVPGRANIMGSMKQVNTLFYQNISQGEVIEI